jgi:hypothetical protein
MFTLRLWLGLKSSETRHLPTPRLKTQTAIALLLLGIAGCRCLAEPMPVYPTVGPAEPENVGFLVVYSATEPYNDGDLMYYTHTDYDLYSSRGIFLKKIRNSIVKGDEVPEKVPLPPGRYLVQAESENDGIVRVPVIIAYGRTTIVNLEGDRRGSGRRARR